MIKTNGQVAGEPDKDIEMDAELEPGFKMTELGPLPEDWQIVKLGDIADIKYGKAKPKYSGNIPVVGSGGIYSRTSEALVNFPSIIIGRKGKAGFAWLMKEPFWPSDTTFYLEWKKKVDIRYIFYYMRYNPLSGEHAKTTLPSLQKSDLEKYSIPLPSLDEQQEIVHALKAVQRGIEETGKVVDAARELKKSLMRHLFT
ncbi:MAG: restriction endonuclease subunit S, partial [Firmicutes bacterium]|nr:restriction endonuclease subunit S [Bacillota bacterium]